jgi:hypothetical protein
MNAQNFQRESAWVDAIEQQQCPDRSDGEPARAMQRGQRSLGWQQVDFATVGDDCDSTPTTAGIIDVTLHTYIHTNIGMDFYFKMILVS